MNIYNKLYILEYSRDCNYLLLFGEKYWLLNLSEKKYHYTHRDFDLFSYVSGGVKGWYQYDQRHRLLNPAIINFTSSFYRNMICKYYLIRDKYVYY